MKKTFLLTIGIFIATLNYSFTNDWKNDVTQLISEFKNCDNKSKTSICKTYCAQAIKKVYGITDFDAPSKPGGFLGINDVAKLIKSSSNWKLIGDATNQDILNKAQESANSNKAVVAMMESENGVSHIAIILPGTLTISGKTGMKYPNSLSFFINNFNNSYCSKPLSYSFKNMEGIKIYARL